MSNKWESTDLKHSNDLRAFFEYSNDMQDNSKNIEKRNLGKKRKIWIIFDDTIADMINNKKLNPVMTELFLRGRRLNIYIIFYNTIIF